MKPGTKNEAVGTHAGLDGSDKLWTSDGEHVPVANASKHELQW